MLSLYTVVLVLLAYCTQSETWKENRQALPPVGKCMSGHVYYFERYRTIAYSVCEFKYFMKHLDTWAFDKAQ